MTALREQARCCFAVFDARYARGVNFAAKAVVSKLTKVGLSALSAES